MVLLLKEIKTDARAFEKGSCFIYRGSIRIKIQMIYRLHRWSIHSELEEDSWRPCVFVCVCMYVSIMCVTALAERGKVLGCIFSLLLILPFVLLLSDSRLSSLRPAWGQNMGECQTLLYTNEHRLLQLLLTLLKSFMLVACTGVPMNVR